ncbi:S8 family serine peptidase [Streptomyces sp. CA-106110]|uniref:S8 family serine peptidase n=1 Tax=Streptomyces sp. CA-106110 TaxID=3240044 RepID=UPI003D92FE92
MTELLKDGYDDASSDSLSLIYAGRNGKTAAARAAVQQFGAPVTRTLSVLHGGTIAPHKRDAATFWRFVTGSQGLRGPLNKLWLNGRSRVSLDQSTAIVGAPEVWNTLGYTGKGVTVADLDTGYDTAHPDFKDKVADGAAVDFTGFGTVVDGNGHGTHTASIMTGTGAASGGKYKGMAPDALLLVGKVCDDYGACYDDAVISGMTWAAQQGAKAVNLSLGGPADSKTTPLTEAVDSLTDQYGTLFVVAAGNLGAPEVDYYGGTVASPGIADSALTVGSTTKQDTLSDFSSRGPRIDDFAVKPDIVAPGEDITAARAAGTALGTPVDSWYTTLSGTSMATPHVTGAVALLAQEHPTWRAADFKAALTSAAHGLPGLTAHEQGSGRLDVARAAKQSVRATSGSISFGKADWPHDGISRTGTVTYTNDGATDVTLHLAVDANGPQGKTVPAGAFTLSTDTLTVPAGGTASATLTATVDSSVAGAYGGSVVATADDGIAVRDAFGIYAEPRMHNLSLRVLGRDGKPVPEAYVPVFDVRNGQFFSATTDADGKATLRLPDSEYDLATTNISFTTHTAVLYSKPGVKLSADTSVTLDGREAKPVNLTVDKANATSGGMFVGVTSITADGRYGNQKGVQLLPGDHVYATPTAKVTSHQFWYLAAQQWSGAVPAAAGKPASSYAYNLAVNTKGSIPATLTRRIHDSELGRVSETYAGEPGKPYGVRIDTPVPFYGGLAGEFSNEVPIPGKQTRYYTTDDTIQWDRKFAVRVPDAFGFVDSQFAPVTRFQVDRAYTRVWNQAPLRARTLDALRSQDLLFLTPGLFSTAAANTGSLSTAVGGTEGSSVLYRNGVKIASLDSLDQLMVPVSDEKAVYELKSTGTRNVDWTLLGTEASATWTFTSARPDTDALTDVPLLNARLNGPLNTANSIVGGRTYTFTVAAERGGRAATTALGLQVSFDDGKTWRTVKVNRVGDHGTVALALPKSGGFASIRLAAEDAAGNAVSQTVIRSFRVTPRS